MSQATRHVAGAKGSFCRRDLVLDSNLSPEEAMLTPNSPQARDSRIQGSDVGFW